MPEINASAHSLLNVPQISTNYKALKSSTARAAGAGHADADGRGVEVEVVVWDFLLPGGPVILQEHGLLPHVGQSIVLVVGGAGDDGFA